MRYWWVNQKQTYVQEFKGGYLWSPKTNKNGGRVEFYENMAKVNPGDIVFSYRNGAVVSIGIIQTRGYSSPRPSEFGKAGEAWSMDGWCVDVEYHEIENAINPKQHIEKLAPLLPKKYSPIKPDGNGNQVYLCSISDEMAELLISLIGDEAEQVSNHLQQRFMGEDAEESKVAAILTDTTISETEKKQLVKSRRGQGLFRSRLEKIETACRVTGTGNRNHLVASHIKPWAISNNQERLDGNNGFLLAPHIDHLFDKGFISFENNGEIIISQQMSSNILSDWGINCAKVGDFNSEQKKYLNYHRNHVFKAP